MVKSKALEGFGSQPIIRLQKRLENYKKRHEAASVRQLRASDIYSKTNADMMKALMNRVQATDSKSKKTKRITRTKSPAQCQRRSKIDDVPQAEFTPVISYGNISQNILQQHYAFGRSAHPTATDDVNIHTFTPGYSCATSKLCGSGNDFITTPVEHPFHGTNTYPQGCGRKEPVFPPPTDENSGIAHSTHDDTMNVINTRNGVIEFERGTNSLFNPLDQRPEVSYSENQYDIFSEPANVASNFAYDQTSYSAHYEHTFPGFHEVSRTPHSSVISHQGWSNFTPYDSWHFSGDSFSRCAHPTAQYNPGYQNHSSVTTSHSVSCGHDASSNLTDTKYAAAQSIEQPMFAPSDTLGTTLNPILSLTYPSHSRYRAHRNVKTEEPPNLSQFSELAVYPDVPCQPYFRAQTDVPQPTAIYEPYYSQ